ncbi:hypothetical protein C8A01DRAFT_18946 [Parachaetomium inaequale]|uniref:Clr5 domain-containing protein n=1 Tax=Parachaetomium inaequale TaxID=2588326 RepID=A0AAN6PB76_9PEZI|nr:hypothetical protein C8A01DRAFT_18946 [Parachaetomium inaequale]
MVPPRPKEVTFRPGTRSNAPRVRDEAWEKWKPKIVEIFNTTTLAGTMDYMTREHNFSPTKRQYVHRLRGWGIKKYKQGTNSEGPTPNLAPALNGRDLDTASTEEPGPGRDVVPCSPAPPTVIQELPVDNVAAAVLLPHMVATQTPTMRETPVWIPRLDSTDYKARHLGLADMLVRMAEADAAALSVNEGSWATRFVDLLRAHTFDWGVDEGNGLAQVEDAVQDIVEYHEGRDLLIDLTPRGLRLDVPAYILLRSALVRFNLTDDEDKIDVHDVLGQFIAQHLTAKRAPEQMDTDPILDINCIRSCLTWCMTMLDRNPDIPLEVRGIDGDTAADTFTVLCTLWHVWRCHGLPSSSSCHAEATHSNITPSVAWADDAEPQLGLRATQLLSTMVCMIMAAAPQQTMHAAGMPVLERALAGANALSILSTLGSEGLLHRFLHQACTSNWRLVAQSDEERGFPVQQTAVDARMIEPFRQFVAGSLGIHDLPVLEEEAVLCDFVLAG